MASTRYYLNFGAGNAHGNPTWTLFQDATALADLARPVLYEDLTVEGRYYFDLDWSTVPYPTATIAYVVTLNGTDLANTIDRPPFSTTSPGANAATLAELRTQVRQRADMENSQFITDTEIAGYLNQSAFELYDLLVAAYGDDYFMAPPFQFKTDGQTEIYPIPSDLYKLIGVDISASGVAGTWRPLFPFGVNERNRSPWGIPGSVPAPVFADPQYRLRGAGLWFQPIPAGGQWVQMLYVPRMAKLVADGDLLDGFSGWDEYVVVDAAIKCKVKEQTDAQDLRLAKTTLKARIDNMKQNRNAGQPKTVQRTRRNLWGQDAPGFPGGRGPWGF